MDAGPVGPSGVRVGAMSRQHRERVRAILSRTGAFREEEVLVALELFDEGFPARATGGAEPSAEYEFVGAFDDGGGLLGYACFGPTPGTDRTWDLYWLAVDPAAQGRRAGSTLIEEVERRLDARRGRLVVVETSSRSDYAAARGFYLARGYDEAARVREFYAPADDRIILTKRLPSAATRRSPDRSVGASGGSPE